MCKLGIFIMGIWLFFGLFFIFSLFIFFKILFDKDNNLELFLFFRMFFEIVIEFFICL